MSEVSAALRFGAFELDRASGELRRAGRRVHLPPPAIQLAFTRNWTASRL